MNSKTRLHLSLQSLMESSNMATHFDPANQPPIIIEKMEAVQTVGFSKTPRENFQAVSPEVLALAVKLARMNGRTARASFSGVTSSCMTNNHVDVPHHIRPLPSPPPAEVAKTKPGMQASKGSQSQGKVKVKSTGVKDLQSQKKVAPDDITHLKVKLREQLVRLNMTDRSKAVGGASRGGCVSCMGEGLGVPGGGGGGGISGRGRRGEDKERGGGGISDRGRRGEDKENEERIQRRRKEQWSRNARMIYDLSQQVKDLEKKTYQKQWHYKGRSEQFDVVKRLAAAQRAALRTLQSFSGKACGSQDSIPPELSLLVQQLALVSSFLGQGDGSSEISASINQLMETMEERQIMTKLAQEEEAKSNSVQQTRIYSSAGNRPNTKAKCRTKKKRLAQPNSALHTGLLLGPQLQQRRSKARQKTKNMHFTQGTFNSARRQQLSAVYTSPCSRPARDVCSAPENQDAVRLCQPVHARSPTPSGTLHKDKKKETSGRGWVQEKARSPVDPAIKKEQMWYEEVAVSYHDKKVEEDDRAVESPVKPPVASDRLSSAIAEQADQLKLLRQDISQKLSELRVGMSNTAPPSLKQFPHLPDTTVSDMIQRLDELVAEEDEIRQRWTSIAYDDPLHINPGPVLRKWKQEPPADKPKVLPHLSTQSKIELENYRQRYAHYLTCTGQSAKGECCPWQMAERIADELLFEVVECVAEEVGQLCDAYVERVYGDEFLRPP